MSYIGNSPALKYASFAVQHFTTSATTSYSLDNSVANENDIALFVNNVRQQPGGSYAYTAAGTTLTLSAATTSSDTMYCVFIGKAVQTVVPPTGSVGTSELAALAVTNAKVADDAIGVDELSATGTASSSTFLRGDNSWTAPGGVSLSGSTDNTITTVTGADALAGEANLTFDGQFLKIKDPSQAKYTTIDTPDGLTKIEAYDDMTFYTNASSSSRKDLHIYSSSGNISVSSGNLTCEAGNFKVGTAGKGIDFSAQTPASGMTAELLDHYEEGTWTPEWWFGSNEQTSGTPTQYGEYTRIGREVTIHYYLTLVYPEIGSGAFYIKELPFTVTNETANLGGSAVATGDRANGRGLIAITEVNSTYLKYRLNAAASDANGAGGDADLTDPQSSGYTSSTISGTAVYYVD